jgi:hypothetical protein
LKGYRITPKGKNLEVSSLRAHDHSLGIAQTWTTTPLGLIISWENRITWDRDNEIGVNLAESEKAMAYLGRPRRQEMAEHIISLLRDNGLSPFVYTDDINDKSLYILQEEIETALNILNAGDPNWSQELDSVFF